MDPRDVALQSVAPVIMVPRYSDLEPLSQNGHRFLVADDGLWLEVYRPWLYVRKPIAQQKQVAIPYGSLSEVVNIRCPKIPKALIQQFVDRAKGQPGIECASWITWSEETDEFRLRQLSEISAGRAHVRVHRPTLEEGEHLVVDLHSHGAFAAGFSQTDNKDDRGEIKISVVVGDCDSPVQTFASRLCVMGIYLPFQFQC